MTKKYKIPPEFVRDVARDAGVTQDIARSVIVSCLNTLTQRSLTRIQGFGTFYHKTINAHVRKDPRNPSEMLHVDQTSRLALRNNRGNRK